MTTLTANPTTLQTARKAATKADRLIRRVAFFSKVGMFTDQPTEFEVSRALDFDELWEAYHLVHDCYVARGYMEPARGAVRVRPFEAMSEMATFVAKIDGRVVAVTSVLMDSPELGLPSDKAFGSEIGALRAEGRRVCEITNLAVHPDYRSTPVFSELTRCCLAHAIAVGYDDMFIAISPEHARFFEDVLSFEPWGGRRSYSTQVEDIVRGERQDLRTVEARLAAKDVLLGERAFLHDFYFTDNPYHSYVQRWAIRAAGIFSDVPLLRELFVEHSDLFSRCTPAELEAIRTRWGDDIFEQVTGAVDTPAMPDDSLTEAYVPTLLSASAQ